MSNNIMLDLETMGTSPRAAVIAIGAVKFNSNGITDTFYTTIDLQSSMDAGLVVDASTMIWWMGRSNSARDKVVLGEILLERALFLFSTWVGEDAIIWGNGAAFDNVILRSAYTLSNIECPWDFWNDRCYRTIKSLYPSVGMDRIGTFHHAADDAESQAKHLLKIIDNTDFNIKL